MSSQASPQPVNPYPPARDGRCKQQQKSMCCCLNCNTAQASGKCQSSSQSFVLSVHELQARASKAVSPDLTPLCAPVPALHCTQRCRLL